MSEASVPEVRSEARPGAGVERTPQIHLSYTDPITGRTESRDAGLRFCVLDDVVFVVSHPYRSQMLWSAEAYTDHLEVGPMVEWATSGGCFGFAHVRRDALLGQIAREVGTPEWVAKREAWLALPRVRRFTRTHRLVRADAQWWGVPNDPIRDSRRGPWRSERAARADLGDAAVATPRRTKTTHEGETQ
jgi:hypothetical protein